MTQQEFENLLDKVVFGLSETAQSKGAYNDPKEFEQTVMDEINKVCKSNHLNATESFHPHAFPDLLVNGFGVEVKHTTKNSWLAIGNSIFEGMRDKKATKIYLVYGKMGGWPEVRWKRYEECITHVRISHSPRFVVEMENPSSFFGTIGVSYANFCQKSSVEKMKYVRNYVREKHPKEQLWWLEDIEVQEHALPMTISIYRTLPKEKKRKLRAEAALLCPEIVKGKRARGKYDRAGVYLITHYGVFAPQLRDLYSAGSVGAKGGQRGHKYITVALKDIEKEMRCAAKYLDAALFKEYWGIDCREQKRIKKWLSMADKYASDWKPSQILFK